MTQNKAFPSDKGRMLIILLKTAPLMGAGAAAVLIGFRLAALIPPGVRIYSMILFLGLLIGMIILENEPGWNVVMFLVFAVSAGVPLSWSGAAFSHARTWILFVSLVLISFGGGAFLDLPSGREVGLFFSMTVIYVIGWIILSLVQLPGIFFSIWVYLGLVLFTLLCISMIHRGKTMDKAHSPVPLAIELFVALYNLFWLSGIVWQLA